jgi:hypothetical protein
MHRFHVAAFAAIALSPTAAADGLRGTTALSSATLPLTLDVDEPDVAASGNRFHAAWFVQNPVTGRDIQYARSLDGGRSFSAPIKLDLAAGLSDQDDPIVVADGNVVAVFWLDDRAAVGVDDIVGRVSQNGGASFGPEIVVSGALFGDLGDADNLEVAISGTTIAVMFEDDAVDAAALVPGVDEDLYVASSQNGGLTFGAPIRVNRPSGGAGSADVDDPAIAVDGNLVVATWVDRRSGLTDDVFVHRSINGGLSWPGLDQQVDTGGTSALDTEDPDVAISGTNVFVTFRDARHDPAGLVYRSFVNASTTSGASWLGEVLLDSQLAETLIDTKRGSVAAEGATFHVVWPDDRNALGSGRYDAWLRSGSVASGSLVLGTEQRLNVGAVAGTENVSLPRVRALDGYVYAYYQATRFDPATVNDTVLLRVSSDAGATFGSELALAPAMGADDDAEENEIAISDQRDVVCVWSDNSLGVAPGALNTIFANGQRFPELSLETTATTFNFLVDRTNAFDEGKSFLVVLSFSGTSPLPIAKSSNDLVILLTYDFLTDIGLQFAPFLSGGISGGEGRNFALGKVALPFFATAVLFDPNVALDFHASTDPVLVPAF